MTSADERETWIRHALYLALLTAFYHTAQFVAGVALYQQTDSPALLTYALDAIVSAQAALILLLRIVRHRRIDVIGIEEKGRFRAVAFGYMATSLVGLYFGAHALWTGSRVGRSLLSVVLAAVSMLAIPIIGSYMKVLAVELRSQTLKNAAIFTFGN